jgi:hypothetical protein
MRERRGGVQILKASRENEKRILLKDENTTKDEKELFCEQEERK